MRAVALFLILAACGNGAKLQSGDYADALTTIEVIANPAFVELNPTLPNDPIAGPLVLLGQKYVAKALLIEAGVKPETANETVNAFSWYWACQNIALFLSVEPSGRVLAGAICVLVSFEDRRG